MFCCFYCRFFIPLTEVVVLSFDVDMNSVLKYAFNIFGSSVPILYLFIGAAFAGFVLSVLLRVIKDRR